MIHTVLYNRRTWLCVAFAAICILTTRCRNAGSNKAMVKHTPIEWLDTLKTFKDLREGDKLAISYKFRNSSSSPLTIKNISTDCGCTVAEMPDHAIPADAIDSIRVRFNSTNKLGEVYKEITVQTDKAGHEKTTVYLQGNVISRF